MFNLLLFDMSQHYFSQSGSGIFMRQKGSDGLWSNSECVAENAKSSFWAYPDASGMVHMIYADNSNNLTYAQRNKNKWKTHILTKFNAKLNPIRMQLYTVSGRLNILCSAEYKDEILLFHCILGDKAQPHKVCSLANSHFWIHNGSVYYTLKEGGICSTPLSDEKPQGYSTVCPFGENVSVYDVNGESILLTTHENRLYVDKKEIIYDSRMEMPALMHSNETIYVMWKSGGYVRYITSQNNGETWTSPMRFAASGAEIQLYHVQNYEGTQIMYGYNTTTGLHIFANRN
ncbi:MAG: hypothetical protein E7417_01510 [Ruminococcaceae bacterium]|nr:hypothetical protein [Oscillospiraceae bacterium]